MWFFANAEQEDFWAFDTQNSLCWDDYLKFLLLTPNPTMPIVAQNCDEEMFNNPLRIYYRSHNYASTDYFFYDISCT